MESNLTPDEARDGLAAADSARAALVDRIELPSWFFTSLGVAIALQIGTAAVAISDHGAGGLIVGVLGVVVLFATAAVQLLRFRRLNGVWLGGLASRVVLGTDTLSGLSYAGSMTVATIAAYEDLWPVTVLAAGVGGAAYALSGRRWLTTYRLDPARHGRGESALQLAALLVLALAGAVVLLAGA